MIKHLKVSVFFAITATLLFPASEVSEAFHGDISALESMVQGVVVTLGWVWVYEEDYR